MPEKTKLLTALLVFSEANFFLALIVTYVVYHGSGGTGFATTGAPTAASSLDTVRAGFNTLLLLGSSVTMGLAGKSLRRERRGGLVGWLLVTIGLGLCFLVGQGEEWLRLIQAGVTISRDLFGTTFFTLTGFHGLHVFMGLIALMIVCVLALAGDFPGRRTAAVESVALYWHFVDAVWVVVFSVVYLGALVT
jgi:heme/copper-type cytochrome/quinol oxidase subunit 3